MDLESYRHIRNRKRKDERNKLVARMRRINPALATSVENFFLDWFGIKPMLTNEVEGADTTEIYIYDEIDPYWGISADDFVRDINDITTGNIDVRLNCPGGDVFDSIAIYNALVKHPANVTVYVDSLAASGASIIAMSADKLVMMVGSQMMIHDAMGIEMGNAAEHREYADFLSHQSDNLSTIYANRAGGEPPEWRAKMLAETWLFAQEAVEIGLADEVYVKPEQKGTSEEDEDPETDEEESDEEEESEEEPMMATDTLDDELESLLKTRHSLANRGWKHSGRNKAPAPVTNLSVSVSDSMLDAFVSKMQRSK